MNDPSAAEITEVVVIPAYEPPADFPDYARSLLKDRRLLLIVDDGSGEGYAEIFSELSSLPHTVVLGKARNHGKGYALRSAFRYITTCHPNAFVVSADCDGQHRPWDIERVLEESKRHPGALCLGVRDFSAEGIPLRSRFGNRMASFLFRLLSGIRLSDTQTGLRAFRADLLPLLLKLGGDRYEYESKMLLALAREGVPFHTVTVETVYTNEENERTPSHFRPVRDSLRVLAGVTSGIRRFALASALAALIDVTAFVLLSRYVFGAALGGIAFLLASIVARLLSSVVQYSVNRRYVFGEADKGTVARYYLLWGLCLTLSSSFSFLLGIITDNLRIVTAGKVLFDLILAFLSFRVQEGFVFRKRKEKAPKPPRFCGIYFRITRAAARLFLPRYTCRIRPTEGASVYLCRHLDLEGPLIALRALPFDVHPMVLSSFFTFGSCFRQYRDYTFTVRFKIPRIFATPLAFLAALAVAPFVRSARAVPAYRGGIDAVKTYRAAMRSLGKGEPLLIFPDTEYTAKEKEPSEIYTGFLYLEKLYRKKYGTSLSFIPLKIDKERKTLTAAPACRYPKRAASFSEATRRVASEISAALMPDSYT